jgi:ubiquinol-cytochrome c reductase cytochrome b subunit
LNYYLHKIKFRD